jgi:hypothetical protein
MGVTGAERRRRVDPRAAVLLTVGVALAGCSGSSLGGSGWFSRTEDGTALAAAANTPAMDDDCPTVEIRRGAGTLSVATKTQEATANDLRYQLSFHDFARQCALDGGTIRMRVGVQGRVVVGPAGAPNQVDVPLRYAVVREGVDPKTIVTKFKRLPVALPPGALNVAFTTIEEDLSFPVPARVELQAYVVYVGFDEIGDRNQRRPAKKAAPRAKQPSAK